MIITIICTLVGILLTFIICYYLPKEKVKQANQELKDEEHQLELSIKIQEKELEELKSKFSQERNQQQIILQDDMRKWENEKNDKNLSYLQAEMKLKENIASLETQIVEKKKSFTEFEIQSTKAIQSLKEKTYDLMVEEFHNQADTEVEGMRQYAKEARAAYAALMQELMEKYNSQVEINNEQYQQLLTAIAEARAKADAITESNRKAELQREEKDFYRLQLSDLDIEEIKKIRSIEPYLRQKEPLNKVIWKVYYEKPYTDLIGRVIGTKKITGIYKITHIDSGKTYIGQAVDIAERWRQHIKRGVGADPVTQNKLYPAMLEYGAENFMFEVLEQCPSAQLSEREKYYTEIYASNNFGFVVRKG